MIKFTFCITKARLDVTCKTRDKGHQEKSRISCCRDKEAADRQKLSRRKIMANHVKNEQHIGAKKTYDSKNNEQS